MVSNKYSRVLIGFLMMFLMLMMMVMVGVSIATTSLENEDVANIPKNKVKGSKTMLFYDMIIG